MSIPVLSTTFSMNLRSECTGSSGRYPNPAWAYCGTRPSRSSSSARQTIPEESMPPLRHVPTGTSLRRWTRTDSDSPRFTSRAALRRDPEKLSEGIDQ